MIPLTNLTVQCCNFSILLISILKYWSHMGAQYSKTDWTSAMLGHLLCLGWADRSCVKYTCKTKNVIC